LKLHRLAVAAIPLLLMINSVIAGDPDYALKVKDLTPVTIHQRPTHAPIPIVSDHAGKAKIFVADAAPSENLSILVKELVTVVKLSTGAELETVKTMPAADQPTVVIGDCDESRAAGIDAASLSIEGFTVKTAANRVYLVGSTRPLPPDENIAGNPYANDGTAWAVADFLERFVGARWYWPLEGGGRSVLTQDSIAVPPANYSDQPVFRKREFHPRHGYTKPWRSIWFDKDAPMLPDSLFPPGMEKIEMIPLLACLRSGNSWPYIIKVHEPQGFTDEARKNEKMFQLNKDGTRNFGMLCYSSQEALDYLLKGCEIGWDPKSKGGPSWITTTCVTVSPGDSVVRCYCPQCSALYEPALAPYGTASKIMALFVKKICEAVKQRWPDKKVLYLPYWNYTQCPRDVDYPGNLEVQMCTMAFGLMRQKQPRALMEQSMRDWSAKVHGPITTWEYSHRIAEWTHGPAENPHLVQDYYRTNRDVLAGSFLNGGMVGEWTSQAPTDYCWMKVLWNPDVDVDAMLDGLCPRMFGKGGDSCRELLRLMCDRWEKAPWSQPLGDNGKIDAAVFVDTWPPDVIAKMKTLRGKAMTEMEGDSVAQQHFAYWNWRFDAFLKEAEKTNAEGGPGR
jgi:hypothetical protein